MSKNRKDLVRLAHDKPQFRERIFAHLDVKAGNSIKDHSKLNTWVELSVDPIEGGWEDEDSGMRNPLYNARVRYSAEVKARVRMGLWVTLYKGSGEGRMFSDPGGGFYLEPSSRKWSSERSLDLLISQILEDVVSENSGKLAR